jgi:hypothetical protein
VYEELALCKNAVVPAFAGSTCCPCNVCFCGKFKNQNIHGCLTLILIALL